MEEMEFYQYVNELWCISGGRNEQVTENSEVVKRMISLIREQYPEAYKTLSEIYKKHSLNAPYYQLLIVSRFCRCNFGLLDSSSPDVDARGAFHMEKVSCPLRGECLFEGAICCPKFNSNLSSAELRVMKLVYDGMSNDEIAGELFISPHTVKNHIKSAYLKLGIHEKAEFIRYANDNNLFKD